jgi:hypothetical protein
MAKMQKFIWNYPSGTPSTLDDWVLNTLPEEDQIRFNLARKAMDEGIQRAIDEGRLVAINEEGYIWKDDEALEINKYEDPIWKEYYDRWLSETGITCTWEIIDTE